MSPTANAATGSSDVFARTSAPGGGCVTASTCVACTSKARGNPAKIGSSAVRVTRTVPISRPKGFFVTSQPSAWAIIWWPKQMPKSGTRAGTIFRKSSSARSIQGARSVTLELEPAMMKPTASRGPGRGAVPRASSPLLRPRQASPVRVRMNRSKSPRSRAMAGRVCPATRMASTRSAPPFAHARATWLNYSFRVVRAGLARRPASPREFLPAFAPARRVPRTRVSGRRPRDRAPSPGVLQSQLADERDRVGRLRHGLHAGDLQPEGDGRALHPGHDREADRARIPGVHPVDPLLDRVRRSRPAHRQATRARAQDEPLQARHEGLPRPSRARERRAAAALSLEEGPPGDAAISLDRHALRAERGHALRGPRRGDDPAAHVDRLRAEVQRHPRGDRRGAPRRDDPRDRRRRLPALRQQGPRPRADSPQAPERGQEALRLDELALVVHRQDDEVPAR